MQWLKDRHLDCFRVVAREGSTARASKELRLAEPTIGSHTHCFGRVPEDPFQHSGRRLVMVHGRVACDYAEKSFSTRELMEAWSGRPGIRSARLGVGVTVVLPEALVRKVIEPAFHAAVPIRVGCRGDKSVVGRLPELRLQFYPNSPERQVLNPGIPATSDAICERLVMSG